jgi:aminoglycoside phosphotransferase (APT) family kinase protein
MPPKCSSIGFISGAYNFCIRLGLDSGVRWIIRFPFPSEVSNIAEKLDAEVATMKLVAVKCSEIPIPRVISFGECGHGPLEGIHFLIMEELEGWPLDTVWNRVKGDERNTEENILTARQNCAVFESIEIRRYWQSTSDRR